MSNSTDYKLVPNSMAAEVGRMYLKDDYDPLNIHHDFKDKDDFVAKRKIWNELSHKHKIMMMLIANIQNSSRHVYSWQTVQNFDVVRIDKNTHIFICQGKNNSHGRYKTIITALDKGERGYYIHVDENHKGGDIIGRVKETLNMFVMDYIEEYDKIITQRSFENYGHQQ